MNDLQYIQGLVTKGRTAMARLEAFDQAQIDRLVRGIAKYVWDNCEELAKMAVSETRMGNLESKIKKNKAKAEIIWASLKGKKSVGVISDDPETGIIEIAKPLGVIGAVQPATNPQVTPMINACGAVKCRNAIILAPHPRAREITAHLVDRWSEVLGDLGAPDDIIQCVSDSSIERTALLMKNSDVVVATGGPGMVEAAYSSGRPSLGVGPGNVQAIIDRDADIGEAIRMIVLGRTFDNGIICAGEQTIIAPDDRWEEMRSALTAAGGCWIDDEADREKLVAALFIGGYPNKELVGRSIEEIASAAGICVPAGTILIAVPEDPANTDSPLLKEKLFPVITPIRYGKFADAVDIAVSNLGIEGKGHSVAIHSRNADHVLELGMRAPVSRVIVNQPCATTAGGSFRNGLNPTSTLGCGSWGNNSASENIYYRHFMNVTRIARVRKDAAIPSAEELWAEV